MYTMYVCMHIYTYVYVYICIYIYIYIGGHMGHGPSSSYHDMTEYVMLSLKYDCKCAKNGQMNVQIVKSQEEMGKVHSYHDIWLHVLNIFYMKFSADP